MFHGTISQLARLIKLPQIQEYTVYVRINLGVSLHVCLIETAVFLKYVSHILRTQFHNLPQVLNW